MNGVEEFIHGVHITFESSKHNHLDVYLSQKEFIELAYKLDTEYRGTKVLDIQRKTIQFVADYIKREEA